MRAPTGHLIRGAIMNAWKTIAVGAAIGFGSTAFTSASALPFGEKGFHRSHAVE